MIGGEIIEKVLDYFNHEFESCDGLQACLFFNSVGGGTGSGFGSLLVEKLRDKFDKKVEQLCFSIYPSPQVSTSVVEPYNSVLATSYLLEHVDIVFFLDNEAVYDICRKRLDIVSPNYSNLNRLIAQVCSTITVSLRFGGTLNVDTNDFKTNLIAFKQQKFILPSHSPILSINRASHETLSVHNITMKAFEPSNMFAKCDPSHGQYMTCCFLYRGDAKNYEYQKAVQHVKMKGKIQFCDWIKTGVKIGSCKKAPVVVAGGDLAPVPRSLTVLSNTTAISQVFAKISHKFDLMYAKRAFVHWYVGEGMEEGEFDDAQDSLQKLQQDYERITDDALDEEEEDEL